MIKNKIVLIVFAGIFLMSPFSLLKAAGSEEIFSSANKYYLNKQYAEAEKLYLLILKKDAENVNALYNLGNTYYHLQKYPEAILYYERAKKWNPDDKAINQNILLTNNKLFSKIEFSKEFFVTKWVKGTVLGKSSAFWSVWMLVSLWLGVLLVCSYYFTINKSALKAGVLVLGSTLLLAFFTRLAYTKEQTKDFAIVMQKNAYIKKAPVESMNAADSIPMGIKVEIVDSDKNWYKVRQPGGKEGWIDNRSVELI